MVEFTDTNLIQKLADEQKNYDKTRQEYLDTVGPFYQNVQKYGIQGATPIQQVNDRIKEKYDATNKSEELIRQYQNQLAGKDDRYNAEKKLRDYSYQAKLQENELRNSLMQNSQESMSAVDKLLAQKLGEVDYQAGEGMQQMGSQMSMRGLGRSSMAVENLGNIGLEAQSQKGAFQQEAFNQKQNIQQTQQSALDTIKQQRESFDQYVQQAKIGFYQQSDYAQKELEIKQQWGQMIQDLNLSSQRSQELMQAYTSLGQSLGNLGMLGLMSSKFGGVSTAQSGMQTNVGTSAPQLSTWQVPNVRVDAAPNYNSWLNTMNNKYGG